jgi:hypothetical protein
LPKGEFSECKCFGKLFGFLTYDPWENLPGEVISPSYLPEVLVLKDLPIPYPHHILILYFIILKYNYA